MQQSKPLERREEVLELARRSCWDNVVRGRFKYLRVSVREGRVRVSCPTRISQRALTRFIEENLEKVAFWMCTQKAQLESRRNANPLSAHLCDGGRVAYEGKVLRLRCDPNIARTQQSAHADELLVRAEATASAEEIAAVVQVAQRTFCETLVRARLLLGGQNRSASEESQYQQCQKAVGQLHATRCGTTFLAFDLFTCGGVGLCHRARACPPAAFRSFFRLLE